MVRPPGGYENFQGSYLVNLIMWSYSGLPVLGDACAFENGMANVILFSIHINHYFFETSVTA